ncbi:MAG: hypothetical protein MRZ79_06970 [Bacteroidia bacterium]|nr:hypothetical protein [Bacteroidia bacterium]
MKRLFKFIFIGIIPILIFGFKSLNEQDELTGYPMNLSEYGFFKGNLAEQLPAKGVIPYELNTPLFTDYAWKRRYIKLPKGKTVAYNDQKVLQFPVGTVIIKTFYYPEDMRNPEKGERLMETRLLIHEEKGWKALPYHWNAEQTEAVLEVAGGTAEVKWRDENGKKRKVEYVMPNMNQCKSCHSWDGALTPIGPSARQLNGSLDYGSGASNQLDHWAETGILEGLPEDHASIPSVPNWKDSQSGSTEERARAWLDINCAHCHNPHGPASTSGFFLDIHQKDPSVYGVKKTPVAAGRGSGDLDYDIVPGKPDQSILIYRMESIDPGIMMPEVGRKLVHTEGVEAVRKWIEEMK